MPSESYDCKSKIERENKQITVQLALTDMTQHTLWTFPGNWRCTYHVFF